MIEKRRQPKRSRGFSPTVPLTLAGFPEAKNPEREKGSVATKARSAPPAVDRAGMGTSRGGLSVITVGYRSDEHPAAADARDATTSVHVRIAT
jgi:hypothetical protein